MLDENVRKFKPFTRQTLQRTPQWELLGREHQEAVDIVSRVLPFRVNAYVLVSTGTEVSAIMGFQNSLIGGRVVER